MLWLQKKQTQLKQALAESGATVRGIGSASQAGAPPPVVASMREQQAGNEVAQLRAILADKEVAARSSSVRIQELEAELRSLKSTLVRLWSCYCLHSFLDRFSSRENPMRNSFLLNFYSLEDDYLTSSSETSRHLRVFYLTRLKIYIQMISKRSHKAIRF